MDVCPVKAIYRDPQIGIVKVKTEVCIGCRKCIFACPFGAVFFNVKERIVLKCDLCEGDPKCVKFCKTGAIRYRKASTVEMKNMVIVMRSARR
jgi:Fe-S-cluster-containing dehydrogenase component